MPHKTFWIGCVAALVSNAFANGASADGVVRGALKDTIFPYLCTDQKSGELEVIFFAARPGSRTYTFLPLGAAATREGSVFTSASPFGTVSVNEKSFVFVTDDEVRSGPCVAISDRLDEMVGLIEATAPDAFDKLTASYLAPQSGDLAKAKAEVKAEAEAEIAAAKTAAAAEIAKFKADTAAETKRLRRENDKLKARICLMDPKATFSICPEVRAAAKP